MLKVIQINLNHCEAAQDILSQRVREEGADVVLISEPYKHLDRGVWAADKTGGASIWLTGRQAFQEISTQVEGFVRARINGIHFYSCYARPSWTDIEFQTLLDRIVADARERDRVIIGGDFNAWAVEWGSRRTNARRRLLLESFALLNVDLVNTGEENTFRKAGYGSIIDITWASSALLRKIKWSVSEEYTHSDH